MTNSLTKIFDTIGFSFRTKNNFFIPVEPIKGYNTLNSSHLGYYIPYLVRNYSANGSLQYEVGIGYISLDGTDIVVDRYKVVKSSSNDQKVDFAPSAKSEFYIFANESNFNTGFNNVVVKNCSFAADAIQAIYLLDASKSSIDIILPPNDKSDNLVLEFKLIAGENPVIIRDPHGSIIHSLSYSGDRYTKLAYNNSWYHIKEDKQTSFSTESFDENTFSSQANATGDIYSFQYNSDGTNLAGSKMYWSSGNSNKLLLGSSSESLAHTIIPTSGSGNVVFNNDRTNSNFRVYGSGERNLLVTYDGRLGLNLPSGTDPLTVFHVVNYACQEGFRLENRSSCHPSKVTLYHKPSGNLLNNSVVAEISLDGKNSDGNQTEYSKIVSRAKEVNALTQKGQLELVVKSANTGISTVVTNPDSTIIGYSNNNLVVSGNTSTKLGFPNTNLNLTSISATLKGPTINLQSQNIVFGSGNVGTVTLPSLVASNIQVNNINLPSIAPNTVLSTDSNGNVSAASATVRFPSIPAGRILTTDIGGSITGIYRTDSFFYTDRDISWNKYPQRTASICLRQIILDTGCPIEEFSVNDQIAIITDTQIFYRQITSLDISGNSIVGLLVNQNLTANTVSNVRIISITKGGYLNLEMYTEPGTAADATSIVLSLRPNKSTVFNAQHKDIDFLVYGLDNAPVLSVKSNNGRSSVQSGEYSIYATHQKSILFPVPITTGGQGTNNSNNSANYKYASSGLFSGMVTSVGTNGLPSYYGTYDQNGNVAEWVEDSNTISTSSSQFAAGGSWTSLFNNSLRSIIPYSVSGGYQDVGFRVSSSYGLVDNSYISSGLGLRFVSIGDINNNADLSTIYTNSSSGTPVPSSINNLGVVNKNYRIGITEITNYQYAKFLNSVASTDSFGLYDSNMSSTLIGGISRSGIDGSYRYYTKTIMEDKPVVFVDYLSAIRFTNWLHNGAPTGTGIDNSVTEDGAYGLFSLGNNTYQITKSPYQKYSLPSLNQWHKAAYFVPGEALASSGTSSVLIRRDTPQIINTGITTSGTPYINYASLSVSGWIYADKLRLGDGSFSSNIDDNDSSLSLLNGTLILRSGVGFQKASIGKQDNVTITSSDPKWNGTYGNAISNTGIVLSANGDISFVSTGEIKLYSPQHIRISGISIDDLKYKNLIKVDQSGVPAATYEGTLSGLLFKENTSTATATDIMVVANDKMTMPNEDINKPLYIDANHAISSYPGIDMNQDGVTVTSSFTVDSIRIGSGLEYYRGSILTHNGADPATWEPAEYLKAEGILWNRHPKRPVMVYQDKLVFTDASASTLANEFSYSDTIAVINADTRETKYIKAAYETKNIIDGDHPTTIPTEIFNNGNELRYCPTITWSSNECSGVSGYAYSVTKGGYLSIQIEQENNEDIQSSFSCSPNSTGYYKPSTLNTISTRPNKPTAFNLLGENIDFAIYGAKNTLYHRYDEAIFGLGADGLPAGLSPALKINARVDNAVYGDASSGVYFAGYTNPGRTIPSGYLVDERAKISINTNNNYLISSIPSGANSLGLYADLSVNGYTYSSGIISNNIYLRPLPSISGDSQYVINAPLTINQYGQIISQVPEAAPTVPGSPTSVIGEVGNTAVTLNWVEPTNNGGRRIINYLIEYSVNQGALWTTYTKPVSSSTSLSITGLTNNVEYLFRISAINSIGTGAPSLVSSAFTPLSNRPSQPRSLSVSRAPLSAILNWTVPIYGSPTNYIVEYSQDNGNTWSIYPDPDTISTSTTVTITGLSDSNRYIFRVKAENANGYGAYVEAISLGTDPYDPPTDPVNDNTSLWDFGKITFTGVCV